MTSPGRGIDNPCVGEGISFPNPILGSRNETPARVARQGEAGFVTRSARKWYPLFEIVFYMELFWKIFFENPT